MALLTVSEADRIIQAHLEATDAPTSQILMNAWQAMVYQMLERLDLGQWRHQVIRLGRQVTALWKGVQPAFTYPDEHRFLFDRQEEHGLMATFGELNRLALVVLAATPDLPPRTEEAYAVDLTAINEIATFVGAQQETLQGLRRSNDGMTVIYCEAWILKCIALRCQTLLAIMLGPDLSPLFKQQYNQCIGSWVHATSLLQMPVGPTVH